MKTSVCEFLRQRFTLHWCYYSKNCWVSDGFKLRAIREEGTNTFHIQKRKHKDWEVVDVIEYFEGDPSWVVKARIVAGFGGRKK